MKTEFVVTANFFQIESYNLIRKKDNNDNILNISHKAITTIKFIVRKINRLKPSYEIFVYIEFYQIINSWRLWH